MSDLCELRDDPHRNVSRRASFTHIQQRQVSTRQVSRMAPPHFACMCQAASSGGRWHAATLVTRLRPLNIMHYPSSSVFDLAGIGCEVVENRRDVARLCTCGVAIVHQGQSRLCLISLHVKCIGNCRRAVEECPWESQEFDKCARRSSF